MGQTEDLDITSVFAWKATNVGCRVVPSSGVEDWQSLMLFIYLSNGLVPEISDCLLLNPLGAKV